MPAVAVADMQVDQGGAGLAAGRGGGGNLVRRYRQVGMIGLGLASAVRRHRDDIRAPAAAGLLANNVHVVAPATAASIASPNLAAISSTWLSSMMNGGASRMWSPASPSAVPPDG